LKQGIGPAEQRDFAAQSRILLWKASWTMFRQNPVLGKGLDNYQLLSPQYVGFYAGPTPRRYTPGSTGPGFVAHSTWFQALGEGGIVMSIPLFALFPMAFYFLWRARRVALKPPWRQEFYVLSIAMAGLWIAFCVASTFGSLLKIDFLWWYMGLTAAIHLTARDMYAKATAQKRQDIIEARRTAWQDGVVGDASGPKETVRR
jgi:O-antigen ligase